MTLTRRQFVQTVGLGAAGATFGACLPARPTVRPAGGAGRALYVGTYTDGASEGIYRCRMDAASGALALDGVTPGVVNPSFLALDGSGRTLYAVNETVEYEGQPSGAVSAFAVDAGTGDLALLNRRASRGGAPCHVALDRAGRFALVANYVGGNAAVFPVGPDGSLGGAAAVVALEGSGPNRERQEAPHAHMIQTDPAGRHALVADLGSDRLAVFAFDAATGALRPVSEAALRPGAGPRHFAFSPDGRRVYCLNELDSTLTAFDYDGATGALAATQTLSTLPAGYDGPDSAAHVVASPDGRTVYASNRGHDSLAVFAVDPATGALGLAQHEPTGGERPRNFALDPSGRFLLAANQDSGTVVTLAVEGGRLRPTGHVLEVPSPVCLVFA